MGKLFYSDSYNNSQAVYYNELYEYLSSNEPVLINAIISNTETLFKNIVQAICYNINLTLFDADLSQNELSKLVEDNEKDQQVFVENKLISSLVELRECFRNSTSELTIFTSGTTGQPKKVTHTVKNLIRNVKLDNGHQTDVWAFTYSATHMAGLQVFFQALLNENSIFDVYAKSMQHILRVLQENKISHISATPTFYRLLLPVEFEFPFVQRVSLGGEKSDKILTEKIKLTFPNAVVNNIYASTEAGTLLATRDDFFFVPDQLKDRIKIIDNEIVVHTSLLGKTNNSNTPMDDWYFTSDIVEWVDEPSGYFKFSSRKNEMINVGGYKVNPHEVEDILSAIDGVLGIIVYSKPNSVLGNILCCNIQKDDSCTLSEVDFKNILKEKLADYKIPRRFYFVDKIEVTKSGKQLRKL